MSEWNIGFSLQSRAKRLTIERLVRYYPQNDIETECLWDSTRISLFVFFFFMAVGIYKISEVGYKTQVRVL